ncbi:serine/threonine protein kinase [Tritrichomonas musculus]|uniref:non-specific serine/threonine protein kinase n=1 Tax=Tritrichomonas musculus TaxID=1915356 RepID=A0ABR2KDG8_9EUKA
MDIEGIFFTTNDFQLQKTELGEGTFGTVYISQNKQDNKLYATKIFDKENDFNGYQQMLLMRESLILHSLKHPGIVGFKGINFQSFEDPTILEPSIITEYMKKGSLKTFLI